MDQDFYNIAQLKKFDSDFLAYLHAKDSNLYEQLQKVRLRHHNR